MPLLHSCQRLIVPGAQIRHPRVVSICKMASRMFVPVCMALTFAACAPGGTASTGSTAHQAPIHVPAGYQGLIEVVFSPTTTYDQALSTLQSAGLQAEIPCSGPGASVDPPVFSNQQVSFDKTHLLIAGGNPKLTTTMLTQIASAKEVVSVGVAPKFTCPV